MPKTNLYALGTTISVILFMVIMNEVVKPRCIRFCRFPIPAELIAVIGGTVASYFIHLGAAPYNVHLVGHIPLGLPVPRVPPATLVGDVALDALAITIVSYSVTMSMAKILAKKHNYEVRANQELLAMGLSNLFGGFFSCLPNGTSLSRSLIQEQTGGKTQLASVVSAALIVCVLLWIAPVFEVLPRVSLKRGFPTDGHTFTLHISSPPSAVRSLRHYRRRPQGHVHAGLPDRPDLPRVKTGRTDLAGDLHRRRAR